MNKIISLILVILLISVPVIAVDYEVGSNIGNDTVYFNSTAKLEFIEGKTNNIAGHFSFEPGKSTSTVAGTIKVDLRTLKTGIDTRDGHMRENHLHTDKYPFAYFKLESVNPLPALTATDSIYTTKAKGKFYIHGVYRSIEPDLELSRTISQSGTESVSVRAKFSINLDEYKIPRPKALFLKLAETIEIEVFFTGSSSNSTKAIELPEWKKLD